MPQSSVIGCSWGHIKFHFIPILFLKLFFFFGLSFAFAPPNKNTEKVSLTKKSILRSYNKHFIPRERNLMDHKLPRNEKELRKSVYISRYIFYEWSWIGSIRINIYISCFQFQPMLNRLLFVWSSKWFLNQVISFMNE